MGRLRFAGDDADFDFGEAGGFEELVQIGFAEAEPAVGVEFARFLELMGEEVEHGEAPAFFQDLLRSVDGPLRIRRMVQGLAEQGEVHAVGLDRRLFDFAEAIFEILEAVFLCQPRAELDHLFRVVDGDDFFGALGQELRQCALSGAEVGDDQRRHEGDEHVRDSCPKVRPGQ